MGSSQRLVLANIILTEFENMILKPMIEACLLKFYCKYIYDTLVMIKKENHTWN